MNDQSYEQELLAGWEEAHKKGQLTLLILLALKDGPKHMSAIKAFVAAATDGNLVVDDKSLYRALRRHNDVEMISFQLVPGDGGPERKIYELTTIGRSVLAQFVTRNITGFYNKRMIKRLLGRS